VRFNYLTREGEGNDILSGRYPFGFDCVLNLFVRMDDKQNNAPFMCFWSRLIQLLQGDDILGDFITIKLEMVFYISRLKILCFNLIIIY